MRECFSIDFRQGDSTTRLKIPHSAPLRLKENHPLSSCPRARCFLFFPSCRVAGEVY